MAKIVCLCGHIIGDQSLSLPYKAAFFPDDEYEASYGTFLTFCTELIYAREANRQTEFITDQFGEGYPRDLDLTEILSDKLNGMRIVFGRDMYECEQCGRLWIQIASEKYAIVSYFPEGETRGVLTSKPKYTDEKRNL